MSDKTRVAPGIIGLPRNLSVNPLNHRGVPQAFGIVPQIIRQHRQRMKALPQLKRERRITDFAIDNPADIFLCAHLCGAMVVAQARPGPNAFVSLSRLDSTSTWVQNCITPLCLCESCRPGSVTWSEKTAMLPSCACLKTCDLPCTEVVPGEATIFQPRPERANYRCL